MWRCAHFGQVLTVASGKKFGTANAQTNSAVGDDRDDLPAGEIEHDCLPLLRRCAPI